MRSETIKSVLLSLALAIPLATVGCTDHHSYRVYDPYYSDYHDFDDHERIYYNQWVVETHRPNRDYHKISKEEQKQYWTWRHNHPDSDRDHDRH